MDILDVDLLDFVGVGGGGEVDSERVQEVRVLKIYFYIFHFKYYQAFMNCSINCRHFG